MTREYTIRIAILLLFSFCAVVGTAQLSQKPLVMSIADNGAGNRLKAIEPIAAYLSEQLGRPVEARVSESAISLANGVNNGEIDIAYMNGFGYVLAKTENIPLEVIALPGNDIGEPSTYNSCLLAPKGKYSSLVDFFKQASETRLLFVNPTSTSGHLIPRLYLTSLGIKQAESDFKDVSFGQNHYKTLELLLAGEADAITMAYNIYQNSLRAGKVSEDQVDVLWVSEGIPSEPIVMRQNMDKTIKLAIKDALYTMHTNSPELWLHVQNNFSARQASKFVPGKDEYYDSIRNTSGKLDDLIFILNFYIN